jgi:hypothetical protein
MSSNDSPLTLYLSRRLCANPIIGRLRSSIRALRDGCQGAKTPVVNDLWTRARVAVSARLRGRGSILSKYLLEHLEEPAFFVPLILVGSGRVRTAHPG